MAADMGYGAGLERFSAAISSFLIGKRALVLAVTALLTAFLGYQAFTQRLDPGFDKSVPVSHPYMKTYTEYKPEFGGSNTITVFVQDRSGNMFNPEFFKVQLRAIGPAQAPEWGDRIQRDIRRHILPRKTPQLGETVRVRDRDRPGIEYKPLAHLPAGAAAGALPRFEDGGGNTRRLQTDAQRQPAQSAVEAWLGEREAIRLGQPKAKFQRGRRREVGRHFAHWQHGEA